MIINGDANPQAAGGVLTPHTAPLPTASCSESKLRFIMRSLYNQAEPEFLWGGELQ